jgi:tRNA dimethylallyltransferase
LQSYGDTVFPVTMAGIAMPKPVLDARIEARFAGMRDAGLVDEVRALTEGAGLSRSARQAIGYKEVLAHLEGDASLDDAFDEAVRRTKRFARRQVRWFRRDPRITWLAAGENPCDLLPELLALWSR